MEDSAIIDLYWARDEQAIAQTERSYGRKLQQLAYRIVQSIEDAEESVSDTYMKAWETIPPQRPVYFFAYLAKLCRNFALGRLDWNNAAKRKAEVVTLTAEMELCIPGTSMEQSQEGKEIGELLNRFLESLTQENRLIFMRRYWYTDSVVDIAARYGISQSKVKTQLHRVRAKLRTFLEKEVICV